MSGMLCNLLVMVEAFFRKHGLEAGLESLTLSASQASVVAAAQSKNLLVYGAPGVGKTTALKAAVLANLRDGLLPNELLVLAANRSAATSLRDELALEFQGATPGPLARTLASFAFNILREYSLHRGFKVPELITGSEQDQILSELVAEFLKAPLPAEWPKHLKHQVMELRGFRSELRDLITVALEHELDPEELVQLGTRNDRLEWVAMAHFYGQYVDRLRQPENENRHDPSTLLTYVNNLLASEAWPEVAHALKLIVVDDAQELTPAAKALLARLASRGARLILIGDPDATTMGFRAADPLSMNNLIQEISKGNFQRIDLVEDAGNRHPDLSRVLSKTGGKISTALGGTHRSALNVEPVEEVTNVEVQVFDQPTSEMSWVANRLRQLHLLDGVPWSQIALVARSRGVLEGWATSLSANSVPTRIEGSQAAFKDEFASGHLLRLAQHCIEAPELTREVCLDVLRNPFSGLDSLLIRRLRRRLRQMELNNGSSRTSDELLVELFEKHEDVSKEIFGEEGKRVRRFLKVLDRAKQQARESETTAYELLWTLWASSVPEAEWKKNANAIGEVAMQAGRNLDAITGLFAAANRYAERHPKAGPTGFILEQLNQDVPQDTLAVSSRDVEKVTLTTSAGLLGKRFKVVVLPELIEGVWPNLKPRSTLLGARALDSLLSGLDSTQPKQAELDDELRMLHKAVGAASERLLVSAVDGEETQYSQFFRLLTDTIPEAVNFSEPHYTLRGMVGKLRRTLVSTESETKRLEAAYGLGRLAIESVPGADPSQWAGILKFDSPEALVPLKDGESGKVWVMPSQLDNFIKCPLHWFMQAHGGTDKSFEANFGTLLHKVLEETKSSDFDSLWEGVRSKWHTLEFEASWVEKQEIRKAQRMVKNLSDYLEERASKGYQLVGVEMPLDVEIGSARVVGRVDRIEKDPEGKLVIVDLKTGKTAPKAEENAQLGLYQLAYLNKGFESELIEEAELAGAALLLVGGPNKKLSEQESLAQSPELHDHFMALLETAVEGMSGAEFNAHLGTHCDDPNSYGNCRLLLTKAVSYVD